jgi:hypothetical protein
MGPSTTKRLSSQDLLYLPIWMVLQLAVCFRSDRIGAHGHSKPFNCRIKGFKRQERKQQYSRQLADRHFRDAEEGERRTLLDRGSDYVIFLLRTYQAFLAMQQNKEKGKHRLNQVK